MNHIYKNIALYNPWHIDTSFQINVTKKKRDLFGTLVKTLHQSISVSISGLRRTGKTTLQQQLINHYLKKQVSPKQILYYIFNENDTDLTHVLETFFNLQPKDSYYKNDFYIFLDELQYVRNWQSIIKTHYDLNNQIRFIVSGSASVYLHQETAESLAGRMIDYQLSPLLFSEYLFLKNNIRVEGQFSQLLAPTLADEERLTLIKQRVALLTSYQSDLNYYLKYGEFPKLIFSHDAEFNQAYLQSSIVDKILQKDIQVFEITKLQELAALYRSALSNTGQVFSLNNAASKLQLSYPSVTKYLRALELSFLVKTIKNDLSSVRSQEAAPKKVFSTSTNLVCLLLNIDSPLEPNYLPFKGHLVETYVYHHLKSLGEVFYYNHREKEVDFVVKTKQGIIPVEVKTGNKLKKTQLNHLWWYLNKKDLPIGYLLYDGEIKMIENEGKKIFLLPWWVV